MEVALWSVVDGVPRRVEARRQFLEVDLETWVEQHPELVMDGMTWVGRQVVLPDRYRLDLVGVTREGELVITELKRGHIDIGTLTQAMHYLLAIAAMDADAFLRRLKLDDDQHESLSTAFSEEGELAISLLLVGTGKAPGLEQAASFLSERGLDVPIRMVSFSAFADDSGQIFLAREIDEHEQGPHDLTPRQRSRRAASVERVQERAREHDVGDVFEFAIDTAHRLGLRVKPWPRSITIVPPFTRGRTLLYLSPREPDRVHTGYHVDNFTSLYDAEETAVEAALGGNWADLTSEDAKQQIRRFAELMSELQATDDE